MDAVVRLLKLGDPQDAGLLAAMWNASEEGWPGGWTHGVPETAERVLERTQNAERLAIFVVERGGEIVGYGDVREEHGRDGVAYLPLLNVRPDCHGGGLGKALILKVLETVVSRGYTQLTLGTWAGNLKAVPLYKKTGFFWAPETDVWMQNFIPTALGMPIARPFFARHDWYAAFRRELKVAPDEIEWNGVKTYPYHFQAGEERFSVWIDTQAEAPTAVETNDVRISCVVGKEEAVCGLEHLARWEIERIGTPGAPLQATLIAEGEQGIGLKVLESFSVQDRVVVERPFVISPEVTKKEPGLPAHQIRSTVILDGVPVVLGTAVKPVQPVEILFDGQSFTPGKPDEKVVVNLRSRLEFPVRGELLIEPHPALRFDRLSAPFRLDAKGWTSCTFRLQGTIEGAHPVRLRAVCRAAEGAEGAPVPPLATKARTVTFHSLPLDTVYTWVDEEAEALHIEAPALWVRIGLRGGGMGIHERVSGRRVISQRFPELGPPFSGGRHVEPLFPYRVEKQEGKVTVTLLQPAEGAPGVTVEKRITVGAGSHVRVAHRVVNATGLPQKRKLRCGGWAQLDEKITVPLADGLLHEPLEGWGMFPLGDRDLPKKPSEYAEGWQAWEEGGLVCGIVYGADAERDGLSLEYDLSELAPQSHLDLEPITLVAGRGNWESVRQLWRWLYQPGGTRETRRPRAFPVLSAGFEPSPLLITAAETLVVLAVHNRRDKALAGRIQVAEAPLELSFDSAELSGVKRGRPFRQEITARAPDLAPRVVTTRLVVAEETAPREFAAPVVVLGDAGLPVQVTRRPGALTGSEAGVLMEVGNGRLAFAVAPGFMGSVVALGDGETNDLQSAYPEARARAWMNPWFGGIHPVLGAMGDVRFAKERFTGSAVARTGGRGIAWEGVRVACDVQHKEFRWLRLELEYLTLGASNVLAVVQRVINRTDARQGVRAGLCLWPAVGGTTAENILHWTQERPRPEQAASTDEAERVLRSRAQGEFGCGPRCGRWAAVANARTGGALAVMATHPEARLEANDEGKQGFALEAMRWVGLEPGETRELLWWVVRAGSAEEGAAYRVLGEVDELP